MLQLRIDAKGMGAVRMTHRGKWGKRAQAYLKYKGNITRIAEQAMREQGLEQTTDAVVLRVLFYFAPPKSYTKKKLTDALAGVLRYKKKPDLDNLIKGIMDGLNGTIYKDDNQVIELYARKNYGTEDYIEVEIAKA